MNLMWVVVVHHSGAHQDFVGLIHSVLLHPSFLEVTSLAWFVNSSAELIFTGRPWCLTVV